MPSCNNRQLADFIAEHYDIGSLVGQENLPVGTVNTSYMIEALRAGVVDRYLLRIYKQGTQAGEIEFEHALLDHLTANGFDLVAPALATRRGPSWVQRREETGDGCRTVFYAVFKFLPGEDKYPWDDPACTSSELQSSARVLARYHEAVCGFVPRGQRQEPRILEFLPQIADKTQHYLELGGQTSFDRLLHRHGHLLTANIDGTRRDLNPVAGSDMPELAIHCDYHPGNLKYRQSRVTGLFDFDWSKVDYRLFDVALGLYYFCTLWRGERDGELHTGKLAEFLNTYQSAGAENPHMGPLSAAELACLMPMIAAANIYVLNWTLVDFYSKSCDPVLYGAYLEHHARQMQWAGESRNRKTLDRIVRGAIPID